MSDYSNTLVLIVFFVSLAVYFLPALVASTRLHPNSKPIMLLNVFLGWTLIGWVGALVWSASKIDGQAAKNEEPASEPDKYAKLERISLLKERGVLSKSEFLAEKARILEG
jgi:hypothetical protein